MEIPESNSNIYPEPLIPLSVAKDLTNSDTKALVKELHNIYLELQNLNSILRRK